MTAPDKVRDSALQHVASGSAAQKTLTRRLSGRLGRCSAGLSAGALTISVSAMAMAQQTNIFMKDNSPKFTAVPEPELTEAELAAATAGTASLIGDSIMGVPLNTLFFIAAGVIAVFWFTVGGGRKPKVAPRS